MLGKLMKYDLKWTYVVLIVFYILSLIFSILGRSLSLIENSTIFNIISQVCIVASIGMIINCLINNLMRLWARFVKNLYKDESYLTHTLPVNRKTIYLSKVITGIISLFLTVIVIIACIAICYYSKENLLVLQNALEIVATNYETTVITFLLITFVVFFLQMVFVLLSGFLGIILGHKSNNNKMVKSVIYGFLLYLIPQIVTLSIIFIIGLLNQDIMNLFTTTDIVSIEAVKAIMNLAIIIYLVYNIIYYIIGKKQFEKGVNID